MKVLIAGAGSLGTVYGGYLARAGHEVQLLARPAHAEAITAAGGVTVHSVSESFDAGLRAVADPSAVEPVEIVVLLCKAPDSAALLASLAHIAADVQVAVSLQNGVAGRDLLLGWCDPVAVIGGVSMVGGTMTDPGAAAHTFAGPTFVGDVDGAPGRAQVFAAALSATGLEVVQTEQIASVELSKLVHASPSMAIPALTRLAFHHIFLVPELADLVLSLVTEGVEIADATGVSVADWPHLLPIRTLAHVSRSVALDHIRRHGEHMVQAGMTTVQISMLQSVERGRQTEVEAVHGWLARTAATHAIAAPVTDSVYRLIAGLDATRRPDDDHS